MAKLPGGEVVFKVPAVMAEKANKVLGMGVLSWLKTKESIYFVTAANSVKRS